MALVLLNQTVLIWAINESFICICDTISEFWKSHNFFFLFYVCLFVMFICCIPLSWTHWYIEIPCLICILNLFQECHVWNWLNSSCCLLLLVTRSTRLIGLHAHCLLITVPTKRRKDKILWIARDVFQESFEYTPSGILHPPTAPVFVIKL